MDSASVVNLNDLIDGRTVRASTIVFLAIVTLAMVGDGFDLAAIGLVAPELVKAWHIAPAQLAPVFTAGLVGMFIGAPLLGYVGDRFGRKKAILIALCIYGALSLVTMAASSLVQFEILRFLTGIGLGGMIPNILALTAEMAPKRLRGTFTIISLFGVPAGIALPGWVAALLVPSHGWPVLLLVGGLLPLGTAALGLFILPESLKFLVQRGGRDYDVRRLARDIRPDLPIGSQTSFCVGSNAAEVPGASPKKLFEGALAIITPAMWIALAANQMTNFFTLSWLPTLLQSAGLSTAQAGINSSLFSMGGIVGGLALILVIDRLGALPIVVLFLLGIPLVASIGTPGLSLTSIGMLIACAGFCVTGNNFGINSAMVMIYPTSVRSMGAGWAQAVGRLGALAAPIIGGGLLGMHLPAQELYFVPAFSLLIGAIASGIMVMSCVRRFGGYRLDESAVAAASTTPVDLPRDSKR
jgi:AAHS family 4-hydroxybenzoate transporter-like MFS transporter